MTKYLQPLHRAQLFNTLQTSGLFDCLTVAAATTHAETRLRALDILLSSLHQVCEPHARRMRRSV